jgi:prepilin-type N-terminal cleavage/methylation domain-containing protein
MVTLFMKKNKGFTLIEILIIIAIIGILVTAVLVSLLGSKKSAQDNSAFTSFKSMASPAFACLISNLPGVRLTEPIAGANICSNPSATNGSVWPDFSKYGWTEFYWCDLNTQIDIQPATGSYNGTTFGGSGASGDFCFMMKNDSKIMWCTIEGCKKEGF